MKRAFAIAALLGVTLAALAVASVVKPGDREARVILDTSTGQGRGHAAFASAGPLAVRVSTDSLAFGTLSPGERSAPLEVTVTNIGLLPAKITLSATDLIESASGARIPASALSYSTDRDDDGRPLTKTLTVPGGEVAPGGSLTLYLRLEIPSGQSQWVPAGNYAGTLALSAKEGSE